MVIIFIFPGIESNAEYRPPFKSIILSAGSTKIIFQVACKLSTGLMVSTNKHHRFLCRKTGSAGCNQVIDKLLLIGLVIEHVSIEKYIVIVIITVQVH